MRDFDPDLMARPDETAFQWARRTGMYSQLRICVCCVMIEANGEGCADPCPTCDEGGLYEQAYAAEPGHVVTLGALTDECGHDLSDTDQVESHREECERFGFVAWGCDLCGSHLHGDKEAAVWWPKDIPAKYVASTN
jgi:hypothetical protein